MDSSDPNGFLSALFDLSFTQLVTPKVLKVIYVLALVFGGLTYFAYVVVAFNVNSGLGVFVLFIAGPLGFLFAAVLWRMALELAMSIFTIAEKATAIAATLDAGGGPDAGTPPAAGSSSAPPPPPPSPPGSLLG